MHRSPLEQLPNTYRVFFGRFPALTPAQKALITPILQGDDVVLQAGTGSGKTEGVLAPVTERLLTHSTYFTILYIVPTRALALDMHRRIQPLYRALGLKSGMRTGDSKTLQNAAPHLLILTPESLDVLLGSQNAMTQHFLKHLHVIIIDEVHLFLKVPRGLQLAFLRQRLKMHVKDRLQTIVLSASLPAPEEVTAFFKLKTPFYYNQAAMRTMQPFWVHLEQEDEEIISFFNDLLQRFGCQKVLVFANSRQKCESLFELLRHEGIFSQNILLHYSNLSTKERRLIESAFREKRQALCIATSTLEVGIDIGDVDGVVLMGPPHSPTTFLQRIGRANRRQQQVKFWGVCYGPYAHLQLARFLALFTLTQENCMESLPAIQPCSVIFQQILSCLYAYKRVSERFLAALFHHHIEELHALFHEMIRTQWLKQTPQPGLFTGSWRYVNARKKQQIWSNFPSTQVEYDVVLAQETIATLPLSVIRQLKVGACIQLTGRVLKVLDIIETTALHEVNVEEAQDLVQQEILWAGCGVPICFEVAQKMGELLLGKHVLQGLFHRTKQLLEKTRENIQRSKATSSGLRVRLTKNGYAYDTFLGSVGNFIVQQIVKETFHDTIEGLWVHYDEIGIECSVFFDFSALPLPDSLTLLQKWLYAHTDLLKVHFSWNHWLHALPQPLAYKEIASYFLDERLVEAFKRYRNDSLLDSASLEHTLVDAVEKPHAEPALFPGMPWSIEDEKRVWGKLTFQEIPEHHTEEEVFTARQLQRYVEQQGCPRLARFQHLHMPVISHPRFCEYQQERQTQKEKAVAFKKCVLDHLQKHHCLHWADTWTLKHAIQTAISNQTPLFLVRATLEVDRFKGSPDLIYIKPAESRACIEVWDIKYSLHATYAHQWRVAFYAHLLSSLLQTESFTLPIMHSKVGGILHRHTDGEKLFHKTPFVLAPYTSMMPRLLTQWKTDSMQPDSAKRYTLESKCTACDYFSYCYQEALLQNSLESFKPAHVEAESNDFPKNTHRWFFLYYDQKCMRWQCWEKREVMFDCAISYEEYSNWNAFQDAITESFLKEWHKAIKEGKNPHILVYTQADWHLFRTDFQSTRLSSLWAMHTCFTAIQTVLKTHFVWPIVGELSARQVLLCLKLLEQTPAPLSLYHRQSPWEVGFNLYQQIWNWVLMHVKSRRVVHFNSKTTQATWIDAYLAIEHREKEYRTHQILELQRHPLSVRVGQFRAIGPCTFRETLWQGKQKSYLFSMDAQTALSKFRVGDFLKVSLADSTQIQEGFSVVLQAYSPENKQLIVRPLEKKMMLSKHKSYAFDENAQDWNALKMQKVLNRLKSAQFRPELLQMLIGRGNAFPDSTLHWAEQWYRSNAPHMQLNPLQIQALMLPFKKNIGLIEGPPGTGKTHLLVWTLIALVSYAHALCRPIKILVTAQTHQAIDQILMKVSKKLPPHPLALWKYGRYDHKQFAECGIGELTDSTPLYQASSMILGATGFGIYQLLEGKHFPRVFDWIIFDEASQVLPSYAFLSLIFGKGKALFYGDTQQLPPVLQGSYEHQAFSACSILQELIARYDDSFTLRLNETYRMNEAICAFASHHWYEGQLRSVVPQDQQQVLLRGFPLFHDLLDRQLDPSQPMVVIQLEHEGCLESSEVEARWMARAVLRLIQNYAVDADAIGIIAPHRLQVNCITSVLRDVLPAPLNLPKVDTVERMQGLEFDIVFFSATVSDKEGLHSHFLKDYRRFNVTVTRARKKMLFVASTHFFTSIPMTEKALVAHLPFEDLTTKRV